jgi:hypothetical protein
MLAHPLKEQDSTRSSREVNTLLLLVIHSTLPYDTTRRGRTFWMVCHGKSDPLDCTEALCILPDFARTAEGGEDLRKAHPGPSDAQTRVRLVALRPVCIRLNVCAAARYSRPIYSLVPNCELSTYTRYSKKSRGLHPISHYLIDRESV